VVNLFQRRTMDNGKFDSDAIGWSRNLETGNWSR